MADALRRGAVRARWQGEVALLLARAATGEQLDARAVDSALRQLDSTAGLEAWRASAELAAATGRAELWKAADRRAEALVATSGAEATHLRGWLDRELARLGRP